MRLYDDAVVDYICGNRETLRWNSLQSWNVLHRYSEGANKLSSRRTNNGACESL